MFHYIQVVTASKTLIICVTVLIVLCIGEPDILDGLIKMINK